MSFTYEINNKEYTFLSHQGCGSSPVILENKKGSDTLSIYPGGSITVRIDEQDQVIGYEELKASRDLSCPFTGGSSRKTYKGRKYVIRTGKRGGKYILVKGVKVYV